jgi:hypothetical protein
MKMNLNTAPELGSWNYLQLIKAKISFRLEALFVFSQSPSGHSKVET